MAERRNQVLTIVVVVLVVAVLWDRIRDSRATPAAPASGTGAPAESAAPVAPPPRPETQSQAGRVAPAPTPDTATSYIELLARAEARRQIRGSARTTYLNEILARTPDSILHRWDNRILKPVKVYLAPGTVANYRPAFLDAVRQAFGRWQEAGIPVRFDLSADSTTAEVQVKWRLQFEIDRTGQTDLTWDPDGHHQSGLITLATFNQLGQPMGVDEIRIVALHEIGHLLGLDHSPDSTDLMYPVARVRDLSARDIQSARLLYQLSPGSIR
jgi:hypothetical protein